MTTGIRTTTAYLRLVFADIGLEHPFSSYSVYDLAQRMTWTQSLLELGTFLAVAHEPEYDNHPALVDSLPVLTRRNFRVRRFTYASNPDLWIYLGTGGAVATGAATVSMAVRGADKVLDLWNKFAHTRTEVTKEAYQREFVNLLRDELKEVQREKTAVSPVSISKKVDRKLNRLVVEAARALEALEDVEILPEEGSTT